jgi:hypothetical protein
MKVHIMLMMTAAATEAAAATGAAAVIAMVEPTSAKLTAIKEAGVVIGAKLKTLEYGTPDFDNCLAEMLQNKKDVAAEVANIRNEQAAEKLAVLRQERVKFIDDYATAVLADAKKSTDETKATLQAAKDALTNLVLPNHAAKTAAPKAEGGAAKGSKTAEIVAHLKSRIDGGMNPTEAVKEVIALGYARGSVGTERTKYWPVVK